MKLDELKPGDEIVVSDHRGDYSIAAVTKVTKTQITAGGERYNRRDGIALGYKDTYGYFPNGRPRIMMDFSSPYPHECRNAEWGRQEIKAQEEHLHKQAAAKVIKDTHWDVFNKMTIEEVDKIVTLIAEAKGR